MSWNSMVTTTRGFILMNIVRITFSSIGRLKRKFRKSLIDLGQHIFQILNVNSEKNSISSCVVNEKPNSK